MTQSAVSRPSRQTISIRWRALLVLAFVLLMVFVKPVVIGGDAAMYADDIEKSLPHGWADTPELWNFAHVIWRPMGRLFSEMFLGILTPHYGGNANLAIGILLMLPNLVAALVCGLVLQTMIWNLTGNGWASFLGAFAFLCLSPLLHYSRLGSPYVLGITFTTIATYFAAFRPSRTRGTAILAGLFAGMAVLCWAPFLVSFPAIALSIWILDRDKKDGLARFPFLVVVCAVSGLLVASFYVFVMNVAGIHGVSGLIAWMHQSSTDSKDTKALRMITGMARGFYELGDDAIWLKWYRFHDPYAKVGIAEAVREALSRILFFYASLAALAVLLWRTTMGKRLMLFIAIATLPHLAIALSYESGSPERYMGFLPALFMGFGYVMGSPELSKTRQVIAVIFCCLHIPFNVASASERNVDNALQRDPARRSVLLSLSQESELYVVNGFDPLSRLSFGDPLNSLHKQRLAAVKVVPAFGRPTEMWTEDFACNSILTEDHGGDVWVTKRFLAAQPQRSWLWVEGDILGLTWKMMHDYFSSFDTREEQGGADGFFRVSKNPETRKRLQAEIQASGQVCDLLR